MNMVTVGRGEARKLKDKDGLNRLVHPLGSADFLKIEPSNHLLFSCQFYDDR